MIRRAALLVCFLSLSTAAVASDIKAASCSQGDVQQAINQAQNGDRVVIPAGACSWESGSTGVSWNGKNIILACDGKVANPGTADAAWSGSTAITFAGTVGTGIHSGETDSRITGCRFVKTSSVVGQGFIVMRGQGWRVDNNLIEFVVGTASGNTGVYGHWTTGIPHPRGVVDSNVFIHARVLIGTASLLIGASEEWGHMDFAEPLDLGSDRAVFVEDNRFWRGTTTAANAIDSNYGGRYVLRYNSLHNIYAETHSVQQNTACGNHRSSRSWEIYGNDFTVSTTFLTAIWMRGGTGVVFDNTMTGTYTTPVIRLDNVRSVETQPSACAGVGPGPCNGSSPVDGNSEGGNGYPCRDQIGRGTDAFLWTSATPHPPQRSEPAYFWNNISNGSSVVPTVVNCGNTVIPGGSCTHIQAGRDYINAPRPSYTPFPYPHPLRVDEGLAPPPSPPSNVQGTVRTNP